jgi:hypothetical protein
MMDTKVITAISLGLGISYLLLRQKTSDNPTEVMLYLGFNNESDEFHEKIKKPIKTS